MIFTPKKWKHKKIQKGKRRNKINKLLELSELQQDKIILTSRQRGTINSKQLNSLRQTVNKIIKKRGRIVIKVFPQFSLTKKSVASRMGKGKGNPSSWVSKIIKGTPICEIEIDERAMGLKALKLALVKLSIRTKTITN